jgi:hypothetical protein
MSIPLAIPDYFGFRDVFLRHVVAWWPMALRMLTNNIVLMKFSSRSILSLSREGAASV